jgi:hypothetical protein
MTTATTRAGGTAELPMLFTALGLILAHTFDEAFGHPEPGGVSNLLVALLITVLAAAFYRRLPRPWRIGLLGLVGLNAALQGALGHVSHVLTGDATALDYSGLLFTAGGALLLWLAFSIFRQGRLLAATPR